MHVGSHVISCCLSCIGRADTSLAVDGKRKTVLKLQCKRREYVTVDTNGRGNAQPWIANVIIAIIAVACSCTVHAVSLIMRAYIGVGHEGGIRLYGDIGIGIMDIEIKKTA